MSTREKQIGVSFNKLQQALVPLADRIKSEVDKSPTSMVRVIGIESIIRTKLHQNEALRDILLALRGLVTPQLLREEFNLVLIAGGYNLMMTDRGGYVLISTCPNPTTVPTIEDLT